jgi:hypothetical protein
MTEKPGSFEHNRGEMDRSNGKSYSPPHNSADFILGLLSPLEDIAKIQEDNRQYDAGWTNTDHQTKK